MIDILYAILIMLGIYSFIAMLPMEQGKVNEFTHYNFADKQNLLN